MNQENTAAFRNLPTTEQLREQVEDHRRAQQALPPVPGHEGAVIQGTVFDPRELLRHQKLFIKAQTDFVHSHDTAQFIVAQGYFISALEEAIRGVDQRDLARAQEEYIVRLTSSLEGLGVL